MRSTWTRAVVAGGVLAVLFAGGVTAAPDPTAPPDLSGFTRRLPAGVFLVGADETSIAPDRRRIRWDRPSTPCAKLDQSVAEAALTHLESGVAEGTAPLGWPRSPDCVYLGGYGAPGPVRPAAGVDPHAGVHVRSVAISNGRDTLLWQVIDAVGYFRDYRADLCAGCGIRALRQRISDATRGRVRVSGIAIGSTHTHGGADGYGIWGGLPTWYREQVRDRVTTSAFAALRSMRRASVTVGSVEARAFNRERRDTYYSTPDYGAVWMQARAQGRDSVLATVVNFAAHPTVLGPQPLLHGDWPAVAAKRLGKTGGGVGLVVEGGLGNVSPAAPRQARTDHTGDRKLDDYDHVIQAGQDLADFVLADITRGGTRLQRNDIAARSVTIEHPVTNWAEEALGLTALLDRDFLPGAAAGAAGAYRWSKGSPARSCASASPTTIKTDVSAFRIGGLTVVTGPGELFSNMTEVVKSAARASAAEGGQTMVFGQTQDSLGYIVQSFEVDPLGGATSLVPEQPPGEYEETFMVDRCFGDHVLETQLGLVDAVGC